MNLRGNTILITDKSSAIGLEQSKQFITRNNKVMLGRFSRPVTGFVFRKVNHVETEN